MGLFSLLPAILKIVGRVTGIGAATDVGNTLQNLQLSPDKQAELQEALLAHETEMKQLSIDELKAVMSESLAEIQSPDKFVSRARPFGLYIACLATTALVVATIAGVKIDTGAILTLIAPMWGQAAWYSYNRTQEKIASLTNGK